MDDLSAPPSKNAVSTFFMRLSQRYQLLLGTLDKKLKELIRSSLRENEAESKETFEMAIIACHGTKRRA
jgi:hypothetical protein